jgi:hypothetical protein
LVVVGAEARTAKSGAQGSGSKPPAAVVFAAFVLAGVILAQPLVVTRRIEKQVPLAGCRKVIVIHRYGDVTVAGSGGEKALVDAVVRVTATNRGLAEEFAKRVDVRAGGEGDSFVIATAYPPSATADPQFGYQVQLNIKIPAAAATSVVNSFGDVRVAGMDGHSRVSNRFGDVELDRCNQCEAENAYGRVRLAGTRGLAVVRNSYGDVDLRLAGGPVQVTNRYGTVHTDRSAGDVKIDNLFGNVFARPERGALSIDNRYGDVSARVEDAELAALSIVSRLGRVELSLDDAVPFRMDALARQGRILSGLPIVVRPVGTGQMVSVRQGTGGPLINIQGVWSDFAINEALSVPVSDMPPQERQVQ